MIPRVTISSYFYPLVRISYCCLTGIWLLYEDADYNLQAPYNANWWGYGDNNCLPMPAGFDNRASSLRFTGAPDDWNFDTLNLYFNEFFIGNEARGSFSLYGVIS